MLFLSFVSLFFKKKNSQGIAILSELFLTFNKVFKKIFFGKFLLLLLHVSLFGRSVLKKNGTEDVLRQGPAAHPRPSDWPCA